LEKEIEELKGEKVAINHQNIDCKNKLNETYQSVTDLKKRDKKSLELI